MKINLIKLMIFIFLPVLLSGCGTLPNGSGWGQDATWTPGLGRAGAVAVQALRDPAVWVPTIGAVIFSLGGLDEKVSERASDKTPLFGGRETADDWSSGLRNAATVAFVLTGLAAPSGESGSDWIAAKVKGGSVEGAAVLAAGWTTEGLKSVSDRKRPDDEDDRSFPSGHASAAFVSASLAARNIESLCLSRPQKKLAKVGVYALATASAWGRVEAHRHYPSDVLAGAALGNFFALFIHDAFLGVERQNELAFVVTPAAEAVLVGIKLHF